MRAEKKEEEENGEGEEKNNERKKDGNGPLNFRLLRKIICSAGLNAVIDRLNCRARGAYLAVVD